MKNIKNLTENSISVFKEQAKLIMYLFIMLVLNIPINGQKTDLAQFEYLKQPQISFKKDQKMIVVESKGDPNIVGGKAFGLLFQLYYSSPKTPKGSIQLFPCARWPESLNAPKSEWIGLYALPVPDSMVILPNYNPQEGIKASLTVWEYGEVAEILHLGPYIREDSTINRLREFVKREGYVIIGGHEEEYIVGPTIGSKGDPEKYVTIIRYRVKKINK
ncbi:MAG: hypothetical protein ABSG89_06215 [Bacteroidales bacterium]|jgi:hypothetical protein